MKPRFGQEVKSDKSFSRLKRSSLVKSFFIDWDLPHDPWHNKRSRSWKRFRKNQYK